jgi:hypothetical protein
MQPIPRPWLIRAARRILNRHARLPADAASLDGPQVGLGVWLDAAEIAGREHEVEIFQQIRGQ